MRNRVEGEFNPREMFGPRGTELQTLLRQFLNHKISRNLDNITKNIAQGGRFVLFLRDLAKEDDFEQMKNFDSFCDLKLANEDAAADLIKFFQEFQKLSLPNPMMTTMLL